MELGFSREEYLDCTPRELDGLFRYAIRWHMRPAALVTSILAEIHRDREKRWDPFEIEDFLPATVEQEIEAELAESGEDKAAFEAYKQQLLMAGLRQGKTIPDGNDSSNSRLE